MPRFMTHLLSFLVLFFLYSPLSFAQLPPSLPALNNTTTILTVHQAFQHDFIQEKNSLNLSFKINSGYYLYRDKLNFSAKNATIDNVNLPAGQTHFDEYFGTQRVFKNDIQIPITLSNIKSNAELLVTFVGCADKKLCYPPEQISIPLQTLSAKQLNVSNSESFFSSNLSTDYFGLSLLIFFILGVGLAFTPCVFPMYPILSSIILKQKQASTRSSFILSMSYVQGMAITYSMLGLVVALAGLKYQAALQSPVLLSIFALLFFILSLSMFGVFNIELPSKWQSSIEKLVNQQRGGQVLSVFMMGALSGLIASPCTTAPLSGALLYIAQSGDLIFGFFTLYSLSLGMGAPLILFGTTGGKFLPKAGGWMNTIKTIFGFLLMSVSIVLVSRFAPNIVITILWGIFALSILLYLLRNIPNISTPWKKYTSILFLFIFSGTSGTLFWKSIQQDLISPFSLAVGSTAQISHATVGKFITVYTSKELDSLLNQAKRNQKPVLIDMYAQWCVACKEFETITFQDSEIKDKFKNIVLIKIDVTEVNDDSTAILERYQIKGLPTLILLDDKGIERKELRVTGFMPPEQFLVQLNKLI